MLKGKILKSRLKFAEGIFTNICEEAEGRK